jgi:hypothetical protein
MISIHFKSFYFFNIKTSVKKLILNIGLIICSLSCAAQYDTSLFKYQPLSDEEFNSYIQQYPAYVLDEQTQITINDQKPAFMTYNYYQKRIIVITSDSGFEKCTDISLPLNFDPSYKPIGSEGQNLTNLFSGIKSPEFSATKLNKNNTSEISIAEQPQNIKSASFFMDNEQYYPYYGNYKIINYQLKNVSKNDTIEVVLSYTIPYNENNYKYIFYRIFFHRNYPVKKAELEFSLLNDLTRKLVCNNFIKYDTLITAQKMDTYKFSFQNLSAAMNEENNRPYTELPYITVIPKPQAYYYQVPKSLEEKFLPYYVPLCTSRDNAGFTIRLNVRQGVKNAQTIKLNNYYESMTAETSKDTTGFLSLEKIHNDIVDNFSFKSDTSYYNDHNAKDELLGNFVEGQVLRDISRFNVYKYFLSKLNVTYYMGFIADKRFGKISDNFLTPMANEDFLFALPFSTKQYTLVYPKMSRFGYYIDEYPFYYEGTNLCAVYFMDYYYDQKNYSPFPEKLWISTTPKRSITENTRKFNTQVSITTSKNEVTFNCRGTLSGQFSTLGRGSYLYSYRHPYVDSMYSHKIWNISPKTYLIGKPEYEISKTAPFRFGIKCNFTSPDILTESNDTFCINLSNAFPYVLNIQSDTFRTTNFYPDFLCSDQIAYMINADSSVKFVNLPQNINIINKLGSLSVQFTENAGTLVIYALLTINFEVVLSAKFQDVLAISNEIKKLNKLKIYFVKE